MSALLEIACFDLSSALLAAKSGADRIEFCKDYTSGGLTPALEDFQSLRKATDIPIFVMLRENPDFNLDEGDMEVLMARMERFRLAGADGFVFGFLSVAGDLAPFPNRRLIDAANRLPCTLHRAFDRVADAATALQQAENWGFSYILSSGGAKTALEGAAQLVKWQSAVTTVQFMAGGGIRSENLGQLLQQAPLSWYHSAALKPGSLEADAAEIKRLKELLEKA